MSLKEKDDLTPKMRKIVDTYWRLHDENGEEPTYQQVADEAYDTCADSMVQYTKRRYPHLFDGKVRGEDLSVHILSLIQGGTLTEGDYHLTYNEDGEGYWWLTYQTEDTFHRFAFDRVDRMDQVSYGVFRDGGYLVTVEGLRSQAPTIARIFDLFAEAE